MKERLKARLAALAPELEWRTLWMAAFASWMLLAYAYQGGAGRAPRWFLDGEARLTGIDLEPFHRQGWSHATALLLLMVLPLLAAWLFAGLKPADLGLRIRGARKEILLVIALWLAFIPVIWWFSRTPSFAAYYPRLKAARTDALLFVLYQAHYLVKWTAWEFFFRGFLLFGFRRELGNASILLSTMTFTVMHIGKPGPEAFSSFLGGIILCVIALRSRSIWPGVIVHSLIATTMDFFASTWWR